MVEIVQRSGPALAIEKVRELSVAMRLRAETEGWDAFADLRCIAGVSACAAASFSWLGLEELTTFARVGFWICAVDELFESRDVDDDALQLRVEQYARCAAGELTAEIAYDPLAHMLADLAGRLEAAATDEATVELWRSELRSMLEGMLAERSSFDDLDDYLAVASCSIGVGLALATGWILLGARPTPSDLAALEHAKRAVRFANDLRSWSRECPRGDANALAFVAPEEALRQCRIELSRVAPPEDTRGAELLVRFAYVLVEGYAETDLRGV